MNRTLFLIAVFFLVATSIVAQDTAIRIPSYGDKYSKYIAQLENGNTDIDYTDFRNSFLESEHYNNKSTGYNDFKKQIVQEIKNKNYQGVINATKAMLNIDYTSMYAHMYLQKTYKILGDTANQRKYHDIEFGLINSIIKSGDGLTCETGWHVTQIEEEYFIINAVLAGTFQGQAITSSEHNACDRMTIKTESGDVKTYYFEANKVFEMEKKMFEK